MPSFTFTSPEGKSYTVNGPEGSTQEQAWAILQQQIGYTQPPEEKPKKLEERTWAEAGKDIGAGIVQGAGALVQLPGQLYGLATGNFEDTGALGLGKDISEFGEGMKSKGLKQREANRSELIARAEQEGGQLSAFKTAFSETLKDPALLTSFLAEQAPQLLVPFGAAKIGKAAVIAKGLGAAEAAAAGTTAAIGAGAVQQGADIGSQAYENIYKELINKGATEQEAKDGAINLARATGASAAIISILAQKLPGARTLEETFAGVPGKAGRLMGALKGAAGETASEIFEETGGKFTENLALRDVKPEQSLTEGLGQTAGMAAIGGVGMGGVTGALQRPASPVVRKPPELPPAETPPVAEAPPPAPPAPPAEPPVNEPPAAEPPITKPDGSTYKYWEIPEDIRDEVLPSLIIQNRDRSTQASVAQMNDIAANLDYGRVSTSRDFGNGAPVVISDVEIPAEQIGRQDIAVAANGKRIPFVYAVVSANDITPSNDATGSNNPKYQDLSVPTIRPIAGNGRVAGIQAAYERGTAKDYTEQLLADTNTGINPQAIVGIENPVLVRVMPKTFLTPNIGDISNISTTARLSPVDTAKNDINRFDLGGLEFNEDGTASPKTIMQFINAMPVEERGELTDKNGRPTSQALDRLANAVFYKAYGSEALIDLYAQAADPEAKTILNALARVAPKMAQLEGAGDYDVRQAVIQAAEAAVNARRAGVNLAAFAKQGDINMDPNAAQVLTMFGENSRSAKKIGERLEALADAAYKQSQAGTDMFGEVPTVPVSEVFNVLTQTPEAGGLFAETPVTEKPAVKEKPEFVIDKTEYEIEQELKGKSMAYFINWLVENAPNSAAKHIAQKIKDRIDLYAKRGVKMDFKVLTGERRTKSRQGVMKSKIVNGRLQHEIQLNGTKNGKTDWMTATNYETALHEALHLATSLQVKANPNSKEVQELSELLRVVKRQIARDKKAGSEDPVVKAAARGANIVANERELIAWGLSNSDFQNYLSKIELSEKQNGFSKFVEIIRKLLGINSEYKTALEKLAEVTDTLMDVPIDDLVAQLGKVGWKLGQDTRPIKKGEIDLGEEGKSIRDNEEFNKWFGNSKVVDEDGNPKVMYHGTQADFRAFKSNKPIFISDNPVVANKFAADDMLYSNESTYLTPDANVIPLYVKAENIFDYENPNHIKLLKLGQVTEPLVKSGNWGTIEGTRVQDAIKKAGFDSFYVNEFGTKNLAVFSPNQLKSAIGNKGTFSTESEMIDESIRGMYESGKEKVRKVLQKRNIKEGAFTDVDQGLVDIAKPIFFPRNRTIIERLEDLKGDFWKKVAQGIADQYRTIKDYSQEAYMLARMSKTVDGALEGLMFFGEVFNDGGALNIKQNTKGLISAMEPVGKEVDRYQMWVALNREAQLPADKRSKMANMDELIARRDEFAAGTIDGKPRLEVYEQVRKDMNKINRSVLKVALDSGLIDEKAYDRFINDINYIPFYRQMEDGDLQGASTSTGLTNQYFSKELKGGESPYGDLMENTLRNWSHILSASMKNQASNATIKAATDFGAAIPNLKAQYDLAETEDGTVVINKSTGEIVGDGSLKPEMTTAGKGMVKTMVDGQPMYHQVLDPMLMDSISSIGYMGPKSKFLDVAKNFKNMLQFGVTVSPAFKIRNLFRDSISAIAVTDLKKNPFANVIEGWAASERHNPAHISALAGGGIFNFGTAYEGDQSKLIKKLLDTGVREEDILDSPEKVKHGLSILWEKYKDWGNKSEAANRMALYNQLKEQGMNHLEASFYARDMLDFSMQGSWPAFRLAAQTIPFLNARVQGLYKLGRDGVIPTSRVLYNTITGKEITADDAQKARSFGYTTMAVAMASMLLYLAFKDDEDFKKREAWDRDNFWWIKLPGMEYALRIPKPFEIGAFGTMAERTLEQIIDKGSEGKQFGDSMFRMLTDTFAINPMPQMIRPVLDIYANKDSFTGAPIESAGMERLSKQERQTDATSPIAQALGGMSSILGDKLELSPVQVDYAIKAYFGWLGGTATQVSQYAVMPFKDGAYPDTKWVDKVSQGFIKSLPSDQSRYVTSFYENNKEISQAYADMRHYAQLGQAEKVREIMEKNGDKIALNSLYDHTAKEMANIRKQIRIVTSDTSMDGASKREAIDRMKLIISVLAENAEELRKSLKK